MADWDASPLPGSPTLQAPFPWFGGKSRAAALVWARMGDVPNYVEPFAGSLAVLLGRPHPPCIETVNDRDAFIANFWRAIQPETGDPAAVARWCDWPVNETDQHAVHVWLVTQRATLTARIMGDPAYFDAQVAGRWCWGLCCWIGGGWCSGRGPWQSVQDEEGHCQLVHLGHAGQGVYRQQVHLGDAGRGVHRQRVHLRHAGQGVHRKQVHLGDAGRGVHRQRVHLRHAGQGNEGLYAWFAALADRLRYVRVCCGDWARICGPSPTYGQGLTGVLLDPPYSAEEDRSMGLYAVEDGAVAHAVREWCLANGAHPLLRIVLCGYGAIHDALLDHGWTVVSWQTHGGYGNRAAEGRGRRNSRRERLWCSPACLTPEPGGQLSLGL